MPIFRVKSVKNYTGQKNLPWRRQPRQPRQRQLSGMWLAMSHILNRPTDMMVSSRKKLFRLAIWQRQDSKRNLLLMGSSSESTMNPISSEPSLKWQPAVDLRLQVFPLHRLHQPWGQYFRSGRFIFTSFVKTTAIIFMDVFSTWKPWIDMKWDESNIFWRIQKEWGASLYH